MLLPPPVRTEFHLSASHWQNLGHVTVSDTEEAGNFSSYCCIRETGPTPWDFYKYRKMMGSHEHDTCPLHLMKVAEKLQPHQKVKEQLKKMGCLACRREDLGDHDDCL